MEKLEQQAVYYEQLNEHFGHNIVIAGYGKAGEPSQCLSIECEDCNEVLLSIDNPSIK